MFLDFYKLREQPFGVTPDPRYLYFSPGHREALASLFYGIETGRGFLSLVAEPGMGKTTLLFQLLQRWKGYVHSAFLFQTQCNSQELIRYLLDDLGLNTDGEDIVRMHSELNDFLFRETKAGRRVVVFIDEAQNLSDAVLETVRLLSDFEAPDKKLLQIVLAGQPELARRLSRPGLVQLRQRIAVQARVGPLPAAEVARYVHHRLEVAGYDGPELFTPGALELVAERSHGIPRLINNICFNALSLGCVARCEKIGSEIVQEAAVDLLFDGSDRQPRVSQTKTASRLASSLRASVQSLHSWLRGNLIKRRVFQSSVLSLVIGGLAIYFAGRSGIGRAQPTPALRHNAVNASTALSSGRRAEPGVSRTLNGAQQQSSQPVSREDSLGSFIYVVQPRDTLRDLCMSIVGHYDDTVRAEIRKLNPNLKNPDHLNAGQEIRLPLSPTK